MVTLEELREHTIRKPFSPFWVKLTNGETIVVTQRFRAVAAPNEFVVSTDGRSLRRLAFDQIAGHGLLTLGQDGNGE